MEKMNKLKKEKRSVWIKPWLQDHQLHLKDKEGTPT